MKNELIRELAIELIRKWIGKANKPAVLLFIAALSVVVLLVLGIACANVANLLLSQSASRQREMAVRIALGATRRQLLGQMLMESFLLAVLGGGIGLFLAYAGIRGMTDMIGSDRLSGATVEIKGAVLLFAAGVVATAAFVFGLVPALRSTKTNVLASLKEGSAGAGSSASQNRLRGVFVVAELALSLILLTGAGLMMKSLHLLLSVSPGFQPDRVLTMEMDLRTEQYDKDPAVQNFWKRVCRSGVARSRKLAAASSMSGSLRRVASSKFAEPLCPGRLAMRSSAIQPSLTRRSRLMRSGLPAKAESAE